MHATESLAEADRLMTVCNSCRYCEGLCAVFPAMEMRRAFADGDLNYLANLCHACGACYVDCQFAPPHEFNVNVPRTLARVRRESYGAYAWPRALAGVFARNAVAISVITVLCVAGFVLGFIAWSDPVALRSGASGPGAFYRLMPHNAMATMFGIVFLYAAVSLAMGLRAFWIDSGGRRDLRPTDWMIAMGDAGRLRYLDGGGDGCFRTGEGAPDRRRIYHHLTFYGFLLCFASTSIATLYHYGLGREAPYPWWDLPVVLGTLGGIGLVVGPAHLLAARRKGDKELRDPAGDGFDDAFNLMLLLTGATGLAVLGLRETAAMGPLLAIHLGAVLALFLTMPYSKFVHGLYRFAALVRYASERSSG